MTDGAPTATGLATGGPVTEGQAAKFREHLDTAIAELGGAQAWKHRIVVLAGHRLTPDEVRALLREHVTVVKPGEWLVLRVSQDTPPGHMRELQDTLSAGWDQGDPYLPFRVLVVPGEGLGVVEAPEAAGG